MTTRKQLDPSHIHPKAAVTLGARHVETIQEIEAAIKDHSIVVVGMAQNPHVKNIRSALKDAGLEFKYLEYGSYFGEWSRRLTIKLWSGWPSFPQVFVRGVLIGGEDLTKAAIEDGTLKTQVSKPNEANAASSASSVHA